MRYRICRITYGSALKVSLLLGWLVALLPALCLAALSVQALERANSALAQIKPVEVSVLGQVLARINTLQELQLVDTAQFVDRWASDPTATFLRVTLILTLAGAALIVLVTLLFCTGYNVIAALGGGLAVEIEDEPVGWTNDE